MPARRVAARRSLPSLANSPFRVRGPAANVREVAGARFGVFVCIGRYR